MEIEKEMRSEESKAEENQPRRRRTKTKPKSQKRFSTGSQPTKKPSFNIKTLAMFLDASVGVILFIQRRVQLTSPFHRKNPQTNRTYWPRTASILLAQYHTIKLPSLGILVMVSTISEPHLGHSLRVMPYTSRSVFGNNQRN